MAKRSKYENIPANKMGLGISTSVKRGRSPGLESSKGVSTSVRRGRSPAEASAKGAPLAVRRAKGGPTGYLGIESPDGKERFKLDVERNEILNRPHYDKGGRASAHKKANKQVYSLYRMLHSHYGGDSEPEIDDGKLWIQDAIKHKGALHKSLGVPSGKKIPLSKLRHAEHSKSPTLRKRAKLAETLRGFHRNSRGR